eukprot:SAG11_NODE_41116_length_198_cov_10.969697_1_plen_39_part_01
MKATQWCAQVCLLFNVPGCFPAYDLVTVNLPSEGQVTNE